MSGGIFEFFVNWMVILIIGTVIKLMDDYLDQDLDKIEGKYTLAMVLDKAVLPYTLLCTVMCMAIKPALSGSLFLASYLVGMGHDLRRQLPFGWNAWQEVIIFGFFGVVVFGFVETVSSMLIMIAIQLADDFLDYYSDTFYSRRNFVVRFGLWECVLGGLIAFITAIVLSPEKTILASISTPLILLVLGYGKRWVKDE